MMLPVLRRGTTIARARPATCSHARRLQTNWHVRPPDNRPIILQRIERAAQQGDLNEVRAILAEADGGSYQSAGSSSTRATATAAILTYLGWNLLATSYDYRVVSTRAVALHAESGEADVELRLRSFSHTAELVSGGASGKSVTKYVLPHVYPTDAWFGRTKWTLHCKKEQGRSRWWTSPGDAAEDGAGGGSSSSSSFSFESEGDGRPRGGRGGSV